MNKTQSPKISSLMVILTWGHSPACKYHLVFAFLVTKNEEKVHTVNSVFYLVEECILSGRRLYLWIDCYVSSKRAGKDDPLDQKGKHQSRSGTKNIRRFVTL